MGTLSVEIEQQEDRSDSRSLSLLDLLTFARDGIAEPEKVFELLPEEGRKMLDASAEIHGAAASITASSRQQVAVLDACVQVLNEADAEAKRRGEHRCILCGLPLGFFNRLLRRDRHPRCIVRKD